MTLILSGKQCAESIYAKVDSITAERPAVLATVGMPDMSWVQYTHSLAVSSAKHGIVCQNITVPPQCSVEHFAKAVQEVSQSKNVNGVLVQQPLPAQYADVVKYVDITKDVDCLNPISLARLYLGREGVRPATPSAVIALLDHYNIELQGKNVVIVGRGNAVGKPLALMMLSRNATVTVCHTKTVRLSEICRRADIIVSACGVPDLITEEFVTEKTVVVDVGLSFVDGKTHGDVSQEASCKCFALSPVPGGVGPVTRAMLFYNLVQIQNK